MNMKARPAKSSETQGVRINKSHYTQTIQKQYIGIYNLYYPKFCANNIMAKIQEATI